MSDLNVVLVGSYPPRRCGIATFTADLARALSSQPGIKLHVLALEPRDESYPYGRPVVGRIAQDGLESYLRAMESVRRSRADLICIQHEYGLWGIWGSDGLEEDYAVPLIQAAGDLVPRVPVVSTLHTVRPYPDEFERQTMAGIVDSSAATVVMVRMAAMILMDEYGITPNNVVRIPHGVPVVEQAPRRYFKRRLGLEGRTIISTMGLLDPRKGIEYAIGALPEVVERHPEVLYMIVGETHPEFRKFAGEGYRNDLRQLARDLGVSNHVRFVNQYLSDREVVDYLQASDIYVTPYLDRTQITSGTLAFAVGSAKAIVSTPYPHATEALAEGRGLLMELRSSESLAHCLLLLLDNPELRKIYESRTAAYGRLDGWPLVGQRYAELFRRVAEGEPLDDMLAIEPEQLSLRQHQVAIA
ncbi:MAG TPA: glycosyltransferase family 4 protein [Chloroflexota bacterium]|nr:glycosyltransferase family 4 protein [Chloroflexota bacterium]